jgi:hypothetical protein
MLLEIGCTHQQVVQLLPAPIDGAQKMLHCGFSKPKNPARGWVFPFASLRFRLTRQPSPELSSGIGAGGGN